MTDRFDLVTGSHPASAILRADWADQDEWPQLEAAPGPAIDLDGTTIVEIVPSLYLVDALFPGEVDLGQKKLRCFRPKRATLGL